MDAEAVLATLRGAGYNGAVHGGIPLTRAGLAKHVEAKHRLFWEAVSQVLNGPEQQLAAVAIDAGQTLPNEQLQQQMAKQADVLELRAHAKKLDAMVTQAGARLQARAAEVLAAEAQLRQLQQQLETAQMQRLLLGAAHARGTRLLPLLQEHAGQLRQLASLARARATAGTQMAGRGCQLRLFLRACLLGVRCTWFACSVCLLSLHWKSCCLGLAQA
jgi:hypothetical protein